MRTTVLFCLCAFVFSCGGGPKGQQGWTYSQSETFWFTPQGSKILPYRWFLALEMKGSQTLFRSDEHMDRLRYITTGKASDRNPDALPIGFTREPADKGDPESIGMTCAACHTAKLEINGKSVLLDGGPGLGDYQTFLNELVDSLQDTLHDSAKFQRFASKVGNTDQTALRADLGKYAADLQGRHDLNVPTHAPGFGRIDALGNILNQVLSHDLGIPENAAVPDAPVSYPFIWDAHQHDFVQWNGSAPNALSGPVLRNIGEVLGVFGRLAFTPEVGAPVTPAVYAASSVNVANLVALESQLETLWSPLWPEDLAPIDQPAAAEGKALYAQHCASCHPYIDRSSPNRRIRANMVPVTQLGTDPDVAVGFVNRTAKTGVLAGSQKFIDETDLFGNTAPAAEILRNAVFGVQMANFGKSLPPPRLYKTLQLDLASANTVRAFVQSIQSDVAKKVGALQLILRGNPPQLSVPMYKARPLNGIWATAPYLHNGSVPTLWDLLQEPEKRPKTFFVGSRQYDTKNVGYVSASAYYLFDTTIKGNSNRGHEFGTSLSDQEKRRLVEYLKTL